MIKSFRSQHLEGLWLNGRDVPYKTLTAKVILRGLYALDVATAPHDIAFIGNRFDEWIEDDVQRYGAMISEHWLISFSWSGAHALEVDLERID